MFDSRFAAAFNLWMAEYTDNPDAFECEAASIKRFLAEQLQGREPTYGESAAATLARYVDRANPTGYHRRR